MYSSRMPVRYPTICFGVLCPCPHQLLFNTHPIEFIVFPHLESIEFVTLFPREHAKKKKEGNYEPIQPQLAGKFGSVAEYYVDENTVLRASFAAKR